MPTKTWLFITHASTMQPLQVSHQFHRCYVTGVILAIYLHNSSKVIQSGRTGELRPFLPSKSTEGRE